MTEVSQPPCQNTNAVNPMTYETSSNAAVAAERHGFPGQPQRAEPSAFFCRATPTHGQMAPARRGITIMRVTDIMRFAAVIVMTAAWAEAAETPARAPNPQEATIQQKQRQAGAAY